jgi:hypothetical protein
MTVEISNPADLIAYEAANGPVPTFVENALREIPGLPPKGRRFPSFRAALDFALAILSDPTITSDPGDPETEVGVGFRTSAATRYGTPRFGFGVVRSDRGDLPGPIPGTFYILP